MKTFLFISSTIFLFTLIPARVLASPLAPAEPAAEKGSDIETPPIILIIDGSGSMWGQIEGKSKIAIAREVVGNLMDEMEASRPVGLVVYGHRKKGDCADIETLLEPGVENRDAIKSAMTAINPVGMTPLANTAIQVIDALKASGGSATIILVSDGVESCGGDLCAVIKAAKDAGVDFVLHIVGFDIGESDKAALECAAREGEGVYIDAQNANELSNALEQATNITVEETSASFGVQVMKDGALHDAAVKVYNSGTNEYVSSLRTYAHEKTNPAMFHLPPGTYDIQAMPLGTDVADIWRRQFRVVEGEVPVEVIDFSAGKVSILATANEELWDCTVSIYPAGIKSGRSAGGRTYTSASSNPMIKELSPGSYDIYLKALAMDGTGLEQVFQNVEVKAGQMTELAHNYTSGQLAVLATNNGELWDCTVTIYDAATSTNIGAGGRTYTGASSNPLKETLTPGVYDIELRALKLNGSGWKTMLNDVVVKADETTEVAHNFVTGKLRIGATHNGEPCDASISVLENGKSILSKRLYPGEPQEYIIVPGTYQIDANAFKLDNGKKSVALTIEAGKTTEILLEY